MVFIQSLNSAFKKYTNTNKLTKIIQPIQHKQPIIVATKIIFKKKRNTNTQHARDAVINWTIQLKNIIEVWNIKAQIEPIYSLIYEKQINKLKINHSKKKLECILRVLHIAKSDNLITLEYNHNINIGFCGLYEFKIINSNEFYKLFSSIFISNCKKKSIEASLKYIGFNPCKSWIKAWDGLESFIYKK